MANDLNQCNFIGRLGRDLETRTFPSGDQVANGNLAVGSKWKDRNSGEAKESTEWVRLTFHGKSAEIAAQNTERRLKKLADLGFGDAAEFARNPSSD